MLSTVATLSLRIDNWTEATFQEVVSTQLAESLTVELKKALPLVSAHNKRELAKDISAMANTAGGWILYGVEEAMAGVNYFPPATTITSPHPPWLRVEASG